MTAIKKNVATLFNDLKQKWDNDFGQWKDAPYYRHFMRLKFLPAEFWGRSDCAYFSESECLNKRFRKTGLKFFVTPIHFHAAQGGSLLDLLVDSNHPSLHSNIISQAFSTTIRYTLDCHKNWADYENIYNDLLDDPLGAIFTKALDLLIPSKYHARFKEGTRPDDSDVLVLKSRKEIPSSLKRLRDEVKHSHLQPSRKLELNCMATTLKMMPPFRGILFASKSNLIIYDSERMMVKEFDGVIIKFGGKGMAFWFIETKVGHGKGTTNEAEKYLADKIKKLRLSAHLKIGKIRKRSNTRLRVSMAFVECNLKRKTIPIP